jgi:hypothetical protein
MKATQQHLQTETGREPKSAQQPELNGLAPARKPSEPKLTQQQLEAHLWGAANILRGKTAGQDYRNYILSLMFFGQQKAEGRQGGEGAGGGGGGTGRTEH